MNDLHEQSRLAFEAEAESELNSTMKDSHGQYLAALTSVMWQAWCRALDYAAAQDTLELYKAANADVARIAAERDAAQAEVERLRAELDRRHKEYSAALNRRCAVEDVLYDVAAGKRDLLAREECRELAIKLGVSPAEPKQSHEQSR